MDKTKFVVNPHLDSEGFVKYGPPHYLGELTDNQREDQRINAMLADAGIATIEERAFLERHEELHRRYTVSEMYDRMVNTAIGKEVLARMSNPKGWQEVDGVKLPTITWAWVDRTDEELEAAFQEWQQRR
jgi:hypothetical protein